MPEEKEKAIRNKGGKRRSTDALTSAGYKLFEKLRQLRLMIAKEEAMPPYIIFSDKTLIDMCVKLPGNRQTMLDVSGVGEHKFLKYGQRFLDEISDFINENPDAIISSTLE